MCKFIVPLLLFLGCSAPQGPIVDSKSVAFLTSPKSSLLKSSQASSLDTLTSTSQIIVWQQTTPWADIVAQLTPPSSGIGYIVMLVDDGTGAFFVMDAPADLDNVLLMSPTVTPGLKINAGAEITGRSMSFKNIVIFAGTGTIVGSTDPDIGLTLWLEQTNIIRIGAGTQPVFAPAANTFVTLRMLDRSTVGGANGGNIFDFGANVYADVVSTGQSNIGNNAFFSTAPGVTVSYIIDATCNEPQAGSFIGVTEDRNNTGSSDALPYVPATPAQWAAPAPATPQQAINRLTAAVYALRSNSPIP